MDIRILKTRTSIFNAFVALREKKDLEKITVKELTENAQISKQTFYLHYMDIYDLSEQIEDELVNELLASLSHKENVLAHIGETTVELFSNATAKGKLFKVIFSGSRVNNLVSSIESKLKQMIYTENPELRSDLSTNIYITVLVQGCYFAYQKYSSIDSERVAKILGKVSNSITECYLQDKLNTL
ncbi:MAG: TetR/AcrR family transcriptional regulator [Lachnospiraceae bacterium]|nr:TetR/AcrR family transcriptional regulator [Lachnospiraceae bacterium]